MTCSFEILGKVSAACWAGCYMNLWSVDTTMGKSAAETFFLRKAVCCQNRYAVITTAPMDRSHIAC